MAAISTLKDGFQDNTMNPSLWERGYFEFASVNVTVNETNQQLEITPPTGTDTLSFDGYKSLATYDLTSSDCFIRLVTATGQNVTGIALYRNATDALMFNRNITELVAVYKLSGSDTTVASATYSSSTHAWLRIAESGGTITFYTAPSSASNPPSGGDWVSFGTVPTATFGSITALKVNLYGGSFANWGSQSAMAIDGLNGATTQTDGDIGGGGPIYYQRKVFFPV